MGFRITGLDPARFASLFVDDAALAARGGRRVVADDAPGFPCRVSLEDARPGEELVLVSFEHHPTSSPYCASGPIYVRRTAVQFDERTTPEMLRSRTLSVRAYESSGDMVRAEVCAGTDLDQVIERMLNDSSVSYLHLHFAARGCFACRVDRSEQMAT
jgi:hypothetical protein